MAGKATPGNFGAGDQSTSAATSASPESTGQRSSTGPNPAVPATPPTSAVAVPGAGPPVRLDLPGLGVRADVQDVVTTDGVLGVPIDPAEVGWWTGSVPAGSATGSTVIDGHVDSARTGPGALFHLTDLAGGDPILVTTATSH